MKDRVEFWMPWLQKVSAALLGPNNVTYIRTVRLTMFLICSFAVFVGSLMQFSGIVGMDNPTLLYLTALWLFAAILLVLITLTRIISLGRGFMLMGIVTMLIESTRMIYIAFAGWYSADIFVLNELICFATVFFLAVGLIRWAPLSATIMNFITIAICSTVDPKLVLPHSTKMLIFLEIIVCLYALTADVVVIQASKERMSLRTDLNTMLSFFKVGRDELMTLAEISRSGAQSRENVEKLLGKLKEETKLNIENAADLLRSNRLASSGKIEDLFPQLSATELEVCRLVMKGNSVKGIAVLLGKSVSNVSTVRGNIRKKLGLTPATDLRAYLVESLQK